MPPNNKVNLTYNITPTPLVQLYADPLGTEPISQPLYCDGFGHAYAYLAAGTYTVVIVVGTSNGGLIQQIYPDQYLATAGSGGFYGYYSGTIGIGLTDNSATGVSIAENGAGTLTITGNGNQVELASFGVSIASFLTPTFTGTSLFMGVAGTNGMFLEDALGNGLDFSQTSELGSLENINLTNGSTSAGFINTTGSVAFLYGNPLQIGVSVGGPSAPLTPITAGLTISTSGTKITGPFIVANSETPTSVTTAGITGQIVWDANNVYVCTSGGSAGSATWKKAALTAT
jgi:hypothetical protein